MKKAYRFLKNLFRRLFGKSKEKDHDPFAPLEAKGLKIAESSKKRMHSPWGIDSMFPWLIEIGEDCGISTNVSILAHDASTGMTNGYTKIGRVSIGNRVFIGHNTTVLCGVTIGDDVVIGAYSLVNKDIPSNSVYAGNPAKYICSYEEFKSKHEKEIQSVPHFAHNWYYWAREASMEERMRMSEDMKESRVAYIKSDEWLNN